MNKIKKELITELDQSTQLLNINEQTFKSNIIQTALSTDKQLCEIELARLYGFLKEEIQLLNIFWKPCFNNSWIYLSDDIILEYLTNETSIYAIKNFNERILTKHPYQEGVNYQQVSADNELIKFYWSNMANRIL